LAAHQLAFSTRNGTKREDFQTKRNDSKFKSSSAVRRPSYERKETGGEGAR